MASPQLLAPSLLLGLAALCGGISVRPSSGSADMPKPFDPASDGILVYSIGKTGTTSLETAAGKILEPKCKVKWGDPESLEPHGLSTHRASKCHIPECALYFLKGRPEGSRTWVITSNRNPFARYPSTMFQGLGHWSPKDIKRANMSELLSFFHDGAGYEKYSIRGMPQAQLNWYREGFKKPLGLDISAHPFDFDKKFLHVQHVFDNKILEVLVLRLEDSDQWEGILTPFFPTLHLVQANAASDKSSALGSKYKEFLSVLQYTEQEIDYISNSEELKYFYTPKEKDSFIQKVRESSATKLPHIITEDLILEDRLDLEAGLLPVC